MTYRGKALILTSFFVVCGCASQSRTIAVAPRNAQNDQGSLVVAANNFLRVFDNMEWEPFLAAWSRDPSVLFPFSDTPERVDGPAVAMRFRQFFDDVRKQRKGAPYLHLQPRGMRTDVIGSSGVVTFMLGRVGGDVGRRTLLFVLEDGKWKLAHLHASVIEVEP